jgi:hypothetical protein
MQPRTKLPAPEASDSKDVALALEEAIALWATSKKDEALAVLSRAAEAAERTGANERATELHAAVLDLKGDGVPRPPGTRPPPPSSKSVVPSQAPRPGGASHAPPPPSARAAAPSAPAPPPQAALVAATQVDAAAALAGSGERGLHVWVRTSARDPGLLLVRLLPDGHPAPPGAHEAYLRPAEDSADLLAPKH